MIKNVKSSLIFKKIISHISERKKLKLFRYNKKIQKILNVNIIHYILFSKCYKIGERNGIGKEYLSYNNRLIFKGEYKNGKRNGSGEEYYYNLGLIRFKGDYKNGKRNGKGIDYHSNGNIKFEGEYSNGLKYNGKAYDLDKNLIYELKNGCGHVKYYTVFNKLIFEGEYLNGVKNGLGKEYSEYTGELIFEGDYLKGKNGMVIFMT